MSNEYVVTLEFKAERRSTLLVLYFTPNLLLYSKCTVMPSFTVIFLQGLGHKLAMTQVDMICMNIYKDSHHVASI